MHAGRQDDRAVGNFANESHGSKTSWFADEDKGAVDSENKLRPVSIQVTYQPLAGSAYG
jgi:hypothetical protein